MENNKIYDMYIDTFGEMPPILIGVSFDDLNYQKLMFNAILDNKPITPEQVNEAFKNVEYDFIPSKKPKKW